MWGDQGRCGEIRQTPVARGDVGRSGQMWGDQADACGTGGQGEGGRAWAEEAEIWGDLGRSGEVWGGLGRDGRARRDETAARSGSARRWRSPSASPPRLFPPSSSLPAAEEELCERGLRACGAEARGHVQPRQRGVDEGHHGDRELRLRATVVGPSRTCHGRVMDVSLAGSGTAGPHHGGEEGGGELEAPDEEHGVEVVEHAYSGGQAADQCTRVPPRASPLVGRRSGRTARRV